MRAFQNPADFIIRLAQAPHLVNPDMDIFQLIEAYETILQPKVATDLLKKTEKYKCIETNFREFAENRKASFCVQLTQIFIRNNLFLFRNAGQVVGVFVTQLIISLLVISIFWQCGKFPDLLKIILDSKDPLGQGVQDAQIAFN